MQAQDRRTNMKIVITDGSAANPGDISWNEISSIGQTDVYDVTPPDKLLERAAGADIVITNKTVFDRKTIEALPDLKYIGVLATGFNVIDLKAAADRGIVVTNIPEYSTYATMQHTIALLLELTNKVAVHSQAVRDGDWVRSEQFCFWREPLIELCDKTAVVVGFGRIGKRVAATLSALGMKVVIVPHHMPETDIGYPVMELKEALKIADVVTLHCPLTSETTGLINSETLSLMKPGALLINAARGPMVVEADVRAALDSGALGGYAADVVAVEPMLADNPLLGAPRCVITPHTAWAPKETRERLVRVAADNIRAWMAGDPINKVN